MILNDGRIQSSAAFIQVTLEYQVALRAAEVKLLKNVFHEMQTLDTRLLLLWAAQTYQIA